MAFFIQAGRQPMYTPSKAHRQGLVSISLSDHED